MQCELSRGSGDTCCVLRKRIVIWIFNRKICKLIELWKGELIWILKKNVVTTSYDFGYRMFSLLEKRYILLEVDFCEDKVVQVTSWWYNESKNENVLYGWVVPCQSYEVHDNGKFLLKHMMSLISAKWIATLLVR